MRRLKLLFKLGKLKDAVLEVRGVVVAVTALVRVWEQARADGRVTPEETERVLEQVGRLVREAQEAFDAVRRLT